MPKKQPEMGTRSPFNLRIGINRDTFRGVDKEADPGAIGDEYFQHAENIRIDRSGKVIGRGGQERINSVALSGCVDAIIDDEHPGEQTLRMFYDERGTNASTFQIRGLGVDDSDPDDIIDNAGATIAAALVVFEGDVLAASGTKVYTIDIPLGTATELFDIGGATDITTMLVHDLRLWVLAGTDVYVWDGTSSTAAGSGLGGAAFQGLIFRHAGDIWYGNRNTLKRYDGGSWTSIALPGSLTSFDPYSAATLSGVTYIAGQDDVGVGNTDMCIVSITGATTALARRIDTYTSVNDNQIALHVRNSILYYGYANASGEVVVGRRVAGSYTDAWRNVTTDISPGSTTDTCRVMFSFDGRLYMSGLLGSRQIARSGTSFTGAWSTFAEQDTSIGTHYILFEG